MSKSATGFLAASMMASALVVWVPSPARADCVYVEFYVTRRNADPMYPLGDDPCVHPTAWDTLADPSDQHTDEHDLPDGTPDGYYVKVGLPVP